MRPFTDFISRLPPELLARIFRGTQLTDAKDDDSDDLESAATNGLPMEVICSHISQYWRTVALGSALLWRNITISDSDNTQASLEKMHAYLARSGAETPLHFRVEFTQHHEHHQPELAIKLELLFAHRTRWQRLFINAAVERPSLPIVTRFYDQSAPLLERLTLFVEDIDREVILPLAQLRRSHIHQIFTGGTPKLAVLRLRGLSTHFFRPSLSTITTLCIEQTRDLYLGFERFTRLLASAPQLVHLSIHDTLIDDTEEIWPLDVDSTILAPHLRSLRLALPGTAQPLESGILLALSSPNLSSLVFKNPTYDGFLAFTRQPGACLKFPYMTSLVFCDFDYNSADRLRPLAEALPGVQEFTRLETTTNEPAVLLMLAGKWISIDSPQAGSCELWPSLHTINVTLDTTHLPLLRSAVRRRKRVGHPLRVVRLPPWVFEEVESDDEDIEWLRRNLDLLEKFHDMPRWPPGEEDLDFEDDLF